MAMNGLVERNHRVFLIARRPGLWKGRLGGVSVYGMPFFLHLNPLSYLLCLILLKVWNIQRVISTKRSEYIVMGIVCRFLGIPHIIRLGIVRPIDNAFKTWVYGKLNNGIIVNAARTKEVLIQNPAIEPEKIHLIYNGLSGPKEGAVSGREVILSLGSLHPRKGFDRLIRAVGLLPPELRKPLVIVGEGPASEDLARLAQELGVALELPGFREDPSPYLKQAVLFALITSNEGISNALLEAMVQGIPVLTTTAGGSGEFISPGENGFFTEETPSKVAEALEAILGLPPEELRRVGEEGQKKVLSFFSLEKMVTQIEDLLQEF